MKLKYYHFILGFVVFWRLFALTLSNLWGEGANLVLKTAIHLCLKTLILLCISLKFLTILKLDFCNGRRKKKWHWCKNDALWDRGHDSGTLKQWLTRCNERIDGNTIIHWLEHCKEDQLDEAQWNKPSCSTFTKLGVVHLWRLVCCEWCRSKKRRKVISCLYTVSNVSRRRR